MRTLKTTTIVSAAFLSLLLSACGGGGSSPLDPRPSSSAASSSAATQPSSGAASSIDTTSPADIGRGDGDNFVSGQIAVSHTTEELAAGAATTLSVNIVSSTNTLVTAPIEVTFNSRCYAAGEATLTVGGTATNKTSTAIGQASIIYTAKGCVGADEITASAVIDNTAKVARVTVTVAQDTVQSIRFVDATPDKIFLKDSGGAQTSAVRFLVLGSTGAPIKNIPLNFALSTQVGGIALTAASATTDSTGHASTVVQAGTIPTAVEIIATEPASGVSARSNKLSIGTGMPDQNSMSISASRFNPPGWEYDGEQVDITIRLADAFNNPPPDGTAVQFTTEGGVIAPNCTTLNGACTVKWASQSIRPSNGRVTILATTVGNESFVDEDGDGLYTPDVDFFNTYNTPNVNGNCDPNVPVSTASSNGNDSPCDDLAEAYLDKNENGVRDSGEEFIDFDKDRVYDIENGIFNGVLCSTPGQGCSKDPVNIRQDIVLVMSSEVPLTQNGRLVGQPESIEIGAGETVSFTVALADKNGNSMPIGTTIGTSSTTSDATITNSMGGAVANTTSPTSFVVTVKASDNKAPVGNLVITTTSPKGTSYSFVTTLQPKPLENTTALYLGSGTGDNFNSGVIQIQNDASVLPPGGSARLSVNLVDNERNLTTGLASITFTSQCYRDGFARFTNSLGEETNIVETRSGSASITYIAEGCTGADEIVATSALSTLAVKDATTILNIVEANAQYISFESATPEFITLKGTGSGEVSQVSFKVIGSNNTPVSGVSVTLGLNDTPGGMCIINGNSCSAQITQTSNAQGLVTALVQSGTVPASVRVTATTLSGTGGITVSAQSSRLVVSTGIPDQDSISLAASQYSILSTADGFPVTMTVRLADAFNNPVPEGTAVNFTTTHGTVSRLNDDNSTSVEGGCLTDENSACRMQWRNTGTRPADGKVRILATTVGNESFIDKNGNGIYDAGDVFSIGTPTGTNPVTYPECEPNAPIPSTAGDANACDDLAEAFLDRDHDGIYDAAGDSYIDFDENLIRTVKNGMYDGILCPDSANNCTKNTVTVREDLMLVVSEGTPATNVDSRLIGQPGSLLLGLNDEASLVLTLQDAKGNSLPSGTTVTLNTSGLANVSAFTNPEPVIVPSNRTEPTTFTVTLNSDAINAASGTLRIVVTIPAVPEFNLEERVYSYSTKIN
ncbi:hypothetical protein O59_000885 [Cellvibrio sp. BR]|uniref:hypothetical protein n=1 Tax=Cellvibrio sp. BR TaxID=1134474 RepID=UPI0002601808|nr:hypothetical protein [Cellvibrio sp. BR]EIK46864.1 hypothetical protein O59_000885 [Cellvibrio sp. BR]